MKIKEILTTDVLVVGSGIAGLKVSIELAKENKNVLMSTKTQICSGSSFYPLKASLGTQVTKDEQDRNVFLQDIEDVSHNMHDRQMAEIYVDEINERIEEFQEIGIDPYKLAGDRKACFANHERTIYMLRDWNQIRENAKQIFGKFPNIEVMERSAVISLIKKNGKMAGAFLLDRDNNLILVKCKAIVLASGGFGNIYKHNLNPHDVDGSGHVLALEVGASLVNMEFIQFIPGFTTPKYKTLFGEHTLTYCTDFVDENGSSLLDDNLPDGLTKEQCLEIRSTHGPFTNSLPSKYFDIAMMKRIMETRSEEGFELIYDKELYENNSDFYTIYLNWLSERGINLISDQVKIAPFAHASNGGVMIDSFGQTGVNGLYAVGELAGGIEGANRLGGNSTGACMVFGKRAAKHCLDYVSGNDSVHIDADDEIKKLNKAIEKHSPNTVHSLAPNDVIEAIREMMWFNGNIIRHEEKLLFTLKEIEKLTSSFNLSLFTETKDERKSAFKAKNYLVLSELLLKAMLERKESRGAHFREDYPFEDEAYNKRLLISLFENELQLQFEEE